MSNFSLNSSFLLLEFSKVRELQILHFIAFLGLYMAIMIGNLLIIAAVVLDHHLHTPMYFSLMNLAMMDLGSISVTIPKSMTNSLMNSRLISYFGCVSQVFFYLFFEVSDFVLLTIMAHDRYVAICNPLRYEAIMNKRACIQMAFSAWFSGLLYASVHTCSMFSITLCSNVVNQFFCEIPALLKLTCSDLYFVEFGLLLLGCNMSLGCFIFIIVTYVQIFTAVLRNPSMQGKQKALSTCLPHLTVVFVFVFTGVFAYMRPPTVTSSEQDLAFAITYTIVPSMMNPVVYSMRNKKLKDALRKLLSV
ncbi:olfactory receptor 14I1-like [Elgaria multicarinata webbii]|uniref:olfactory receptor 14I1-like n=1 Tax=Elgaria multicarinata webbii TaxID=159646 RepID=UPI002FCCD303